MCDGYGELKNACGNCNEEGVVNYQDYDTPQECHECEGDGFKMVKCEDCQDGTVENEYIEYRDEKDSYHELPDDALEGLESEYYYDDKIIALSRLMLANTLNNISVYWVAYGTKLAQVALSHGPGIKNKIGTSLGSHIYDKSKYFMNSQKSNTFIKNIFSDGHSPLKSMRQIISQIFHKQISTAFENKMSYSDCVIRIHDEGDSVHLHRDNCNFEMPDYIVSKYKNQLAAILYLQSPEYGGELSIYDKQWNRYDEPSRQPDFGYSFDLVDDVSHTSISPTTGRLV